MHTIPFPYLTNVKYFGYFFITLHIDKSCIKTKFTFLEKFFTQTIGELKNSRNFASGKW